MEKSQTTQQHESKQVCESWGARGKKELERDTTARGRLRLLLRWWDGAIVLRVFCDGHRCRGWRRLLLLMLCLLLLLLLLLCRLHGFGFEQLFVP